MATIAKLSLPNKYLSESADDAPETRIEKMFAELEPAFVGTDPATGAARVEDRDGDGAAVAAA